MNFARGVNVPPGWTLWDFSFPQVAGVPGQTVELKQQMQCRFKVEKVKAFDSATPAGTGTRIASFMVGQQIQRPAVTDTASSVFFAGNSIGNNVRWDVCEPGLNIIVVVQFIQACTFDLCLFGFARAQF